MRTTTIMAMSQKQFKNLVKDYKSQGFEVRTLDKRNAELGKGSSTIVLGW